jgi:hypothetical protein
MFQKMPKHAVEAAFEQDVEGDAEIAVDDELDELQQAAVFQRHHAIVRNEADIGREQQEQVLGRKRREAGERPHQQKRKPDRAVEQAIKKLLHALIPSPS